jgi:hypothetical protein
MMWSNNFDPYDGWHVDNLLEALNAANRFREAALLYRDWSQSTETNIIGAGIQIYRCESARDALLAFLTN